MAVVFGLSRLSKEGIVAQVEIEFDTPDLDESSPSVRKNHSYHHSTDVHFSS